MRNDNFLGYVGDADHRNRPPSEHRFLPKPWPSNVYFIRSLPDGLIKIGWAANPYRRLADFQMASPVHLTLVAFENGDQRREAEYHERFKAHRLHGEWFSPMDEIVSLAVHIGLPPFPSLKPQPRIEIDPWSGTPADVKLSQYRPRGKSGRYVAEPWDGIYRDVFTGLPVPPPSVPSPTYNKDVNL